jgi:hypothetical protein
MAYRIEVLLANNSKPLSFIVFIPEWLHPPTPGLVKMEQSVFNRFCLNIARGKHRYISGSQHVEENANRNVYTSVHNTRVFFLQNANGFKKWPPTEEKLIRLKASTEL